MQKENFYSYQRRRVRILLGWGLLSVVAGSMIQLNPRAFWKQFGLQALMWGAIDAALALFALRTSRSREQRYEQGELGDVDVAKEARSFQRIVQVNAGLDVGYVLGGAWMTRRFRNREDRRGMGVGILVQGTWLLLFDGFLAWELSRRTKN